MPNSEAVAVLVEESIGNAGRCAETFEWFGQESPVVEGFVDLGISMSSGICTEQTDVAELEAYRGLVNTERGAWMDNTTIATATALMSDLGPGLMTPLTLWDLAAFMRGVICYDRIYHHAASTDDAAINELLGEEVLVPVPTAPDSPLRYSDEPGNTTSSESVARWLRNTFATGLSIISNLATGDDERDRQDVEAVRHGWASVLGRPDLTPTQFLDTSSLSGRFNSLSALSLSTIVAATSVEGTAQSIDLPPKYQRLADARAEAGIPDHQDQDLKEMLSEINLRAFVNLEISNFFDLPYITPVSRAPFRRHLYDRAVAVDDLLSTVGLLQETYASWTAGAKLELPLFLAIALPKCKVPDDLWSALRAQRAAATKFRKRRNELDVALARRDRLATAKAARALASESGTLTEAIGGAGQAAAIAAVQTVGDGTWDGIAVGVSAAAAAVQNLISSNVTRRLLLRLTKPHLYYLPSVMREAEHITEALPDFSRIWRLPTRYQEEFANRLKEAGKLGAGATG